MLVYPHASFFLVRIEHDARYTTPEAQEELRRFVQQRNYSIDGVSNADASAVDPNTAFHPIVQAEVVSSTPFSDAFNELFKPLLTPPQPQPKYTDKPNRQAEHVRY